MITKINYSVLTMLFAAAFSSFAFAQHKSDMDSTKKEMKPMGCCQSMNHSESEMKSDSTGANDSAPIDVDAIDINKDGKVYQDQMDWDVITDAPGVCPKCGMKLKEVSVQTAKKNLVKHGFTVK